MGKKNCLVSGRKIRDTRQLKSLSQEEIGAAIGISRQTVNSWEKRESVRMTESDLEKIAQILGVTGDDLTIVKTISVEDEESIYRDLVEANSDYRLVPKTILNEEYRIMLLSEIEERQKIYRDVLSAKDALISRLYSEVDDLNSEIKDLRAKLTVKKS